jgi:hypothetical protein
MVLDLNDNGIGAEGVQHLADALEKNKVSFNFFFLTTSLFCIDS